MFFVWMNYVGGFFKLFIIIFLLNNCFFWFVFKVKKDYVIFFVNLNLLFLKYKLEICFLFL